MPSAWFVVKMFNWLLLVPFVSSLMTPATRLCVAPGCLSAGYSAGTGMPLTHSTDAVKHTHTHTHTWISFAVSVYFSAA